MAKSNKKWLFSGIVGVLLGVIILAGVQYAMKATSTTEFCVSCHSMQQPQAEWEASIHFSNRKGIRAECADCHIPQDNVFHYVKTKVFAVKDLWHTYVTDKLPDEEAFEKHRLEMAKSVWQDLKESDSATCRSCHSFEAMEMSSQTSTAQKMHKTGIETNQTCIDCHKGIAHFMPEIEVDDTAAYGELTKHAGEFKQTDKILYSLAMSPAQLAQGDEVRLMPFAEVNDWKLQDDNIIGTIHGWQQVGAETIVYAQLGQRIMLALGDGIEKNVNVLQTVHDKVTDSEWKEVTFEINVAKNVLTSNLEALNQFGNNLNQTHCSGCHAPIGADHYTANQWIGVVNSMKDRTSMTADDVRSVTIYLQRNAKDFGEKSH
ncbi:NapC/NirT family cytochrome c [Histophilus somni]|uniref:NapC/NirT family cytochrome c n=1 Tax=Histophilus somni TaxID=731 RepID=UPI00094ABB2A|nr:NapC/NirT family cytochrome c [Histophilus somni]